MNQILLKPLPCFFQVFFLYHLLWSLSLQFHGLRVQGIRVGNAEVPNHKPLKTGLQEVYGIGRRKSHQVLCGLGITNKLARDLTGKELIDLREEVGMHQHGDELVKTLFSESYTFFDFLNLFCFHDCCWYEEEACWIGDTETGGSRLLQRK